MTLQPEVNEEMRAAMRKVIEDYEDVSITFRVVKARSRFTLRNLWRWLATGIENPFDMTVDFTLELEGTKPGDPFPTALAYEYLNVDVSGGDALEIKAPWRIEVS